MIHDYTDGRDNFDKSCVICRKKKNRTFDLEDKNQLKMVEKNLLDPKIHAKNSVKL